MKATKKILVLGGNGMIGSGLVSFLSQQFAVAYSIRDSTSDLAGKFDSVKKYHAVDLADNLMLERVLIDFKPEIVINAAGVVKQKIGPGDTIRTIELNSVFPHRLAYLGDKYNFKTILLSTDCVFSGQHGNYIEENTPDATDLYGRSKILGEIDKNPAVLTLRISSIGLEMGPGKGLIEWFLAQKNEISGYTKAIYTGFTSLEVSKVIALILEQFPSLFGLFHVSSQPISKYDLLVTLMDLLGKKDVTITPDTTYFCDRSLNSDKFRNLTGYQPPTWTTMLTALASEIKQRGKN